MSAVVVMTRPPKLLTVRGEIRTVVERWHEQYKPEIDDLRDRYPGSSDKRAIYRRLRGLDVETCTPGDVAAIIGNDSWTNLSCDVCERRGLDVVVRVGQEPDYEARYVDLCRSCAKAAVAAFEEQP